MNDDDFDAYLALGEVSDDQRWAFGTGFSDPLAGVDTTLPPGVDGPALGAYCEMLGDDALVYSHRLQQWLTRAPELEEETALANIALDLLGQARMLYSRAGAADGTGRDEDAFAFGRAEQDFRSVRLVERADADFAELVARLLIFSTWRLALFDALRTAADPVLAAIAGMAVKELAYHRDYAARWVLRLGDGTALSKQRMQAGLAISWPFVDELFAPHPVEGRLTGVAVAVPATRAEFDGVMQNVLSTAGLSRPEVVATSDAAGRGGRDGRHTEALAPLLAELQSVARAHPEASW
ncbi:ring-1,2-phenylacetyl-CoA epoxidase subunit PaaC [Frankineae bacterium MT45]|nr:ring-1,2-phenylacetyl-CoA epoxidase subunit PaaC [Frankineae bacterium MT45]